MVRTIHDGIIEDLRTLRESIDKYAHMGVEKNVKDLKSFAEAILVKLNPDEISDLNFIESLVYMIRHYDGAKLIGNVKASLDAYLATEDQLKELEEEEETKNHNKFYTYLSKLKDIMNTHPLSSYENDLSEHSCLNTLLFRVAESDIERTHAQSMVDVIRNESLTTAEKAKKLESCIDSYMTLYDNKDEGVNMNKMNHAAFYDKMKRMAETMTKIQKEHGYGNTAVAEYLRDTRHNSEFSNIDAEDENDKKFFKDFLLTIDYAADQYILVNSCFRKLSDYLDDTTLKKALTKTSHEEMIKLAKRIRGVLVTLRDSRTTTYDLIATNTFSIINNLKSKLPVADNNDDRFIKQMVDVVHTYNGPKLVDNMIAAIDQWYIFDTKEDPNLLSIDEFSKKISNKKKMDKDNVGYTILCEMKNLVEQTTTKLATNIEEEDFSNSLDKRLINRDLQSLLNSYSNILEILGQYYVKLEK